MAPRPPRPVTVVGIPERARQKKTRAASSTVLRGVPEFARIGTTAGEIDVRLSYRIIELFSEGLYASPNKAVEELVANSFDAGAEKVQVFLPPDLHDQNATIVVIDDGTGMDVTGLRQHWLIGVSNKRDLAAPPKARQQIGKFGIGKLATYVLAKRLTHISKQDGKYFSTSMNFGAIEKRVEDQVEPTAPIRLPVRTLTAEEAARATAPWTNTPAFVAAKMPLFGKSAPKSWTVAILSSLKDKVYEIKPGVLEWVLRTALPLRDDFSVYFNGKRLEPSKAAKGRLKTWVLGKDLVKLPKPCPSDVEARENKQVPANDAKRYALYHPELGLMTDYVEAYKDLLTGKSDELGRSNGFFVYVRGRLINANDGHFGISPDELRHGTFGRFRLVINIDALDEQLRSNRESLSEGPALGTAQDILRAIFNAVRPTIEAYDSAEEPGARLARNLASSPTSLSRRPIVDLARAVALGKATSRFLIVPSRLSAEERDTFFAALEHRASTGDQFVTGLTFSFDASTSDGIAKFDTSTGQLLINLLHPFVAAFHDEFANKNARQPLETFAMAEVLLEAHLHSLSIKPDDIADLLMLRDELLRTLASQSGRLSALAVANNLSAARNNPGELEQKLVDALRSLGFEVVLIGGKKNPDGIATAHVSADASGTKRSYAVSLEAKSKRKDKGKITAKTIGISTIARHRDSYNCDHALVVGRAFPTTQEGNALAEEMSTDRVNTKAKGRERTITLITIDDLARLVRLRPIKQVGLLKLRTMLNTCSTPQQTHAWVDEIAKSNPRKPPYREIIETIHDLQKKYVQAPVDYSALRIALGSRKSPIQYETNQELADLCKGMAQMAPGSLSATERAVELDQSPENVLLAIESATKEYPVEEQSH